MNIAAHDKSAYGILSLSMDFIPIIVLIFLMNVMEIYYVANIAMI